jgi:hypothetical protein
MALTVLCAKPRISNITNFHLVSLLFGVWVVFAYRNVYPLATFTLKPVDLNEGWVMYFNLSVLTFAAIVIPLVIPAQYIPFDPKVCFTVKVTPPLISRSQNPAAEPNPEQTASWFSWLLFFFLDPIIFQASHIPHLPLSEFPPLADYDLSTSLVQTSFPVSRCTTESSNTKARSVYGSIISQSKRSHLLGHHQGLQYAPSFSLDFYRARQQIVNGPRCSY